ncbi:hypothetical protein SBI_06175 [Streptomyces bingchenggensis BCW-1]|uniref:Uncharacterized protein n=1 Tax=Streptomyces bingchenggensis (strain BCW-1) TaxID=749414 RepID=D7BQS8_STRBB|nr:hypothetical protein SBI_06175 [Streptomyces bingchenggensis BCW-1]
MTVFVSFFSSFLQVRTRSGSDTRRGLLGLSAVAAEAGAWGAEGAVAAVAVLEGGAVRPGLGLRERRREQRGETVREEGGRVAQVRREAGGQGAAYGVGGGPALQPGGDARGEAAYVALGEQ